MRKFYMALFVLVFFSLVWGGAILQAHYLTKSFGAEFSSAFIVGFDYMHPWDGEPQCRVLKYSSSHATVYYYCETGGEKVLLEKNDGKWVYNQTLAIWSVQGSADDYFIWPYFKNMVP